MAQYIDKSALVAEIEKQRQLIFPQNTGEMKVADVPKPLEQGWLNALSWMKKTIDSIEVKEVDLDKEIEQSFIDLDYHLDAYNRVEDYVGENIDMVEYKRIAKHFYELGLKVAKKGE